MGMLLFRASVIHARSTRFAVIGLLLLQALIPWSLIHAELMAPDATDHPTCHTMAGADMGHHNHHGADHMVDHVVNHAADHPSGPQASDAIELVCERACAITQLFVSSSLMTLGPPAHAEPPQVPSPRYLSYSTKVPTPPPIA